ncbi:Terpene synthase, N-terminal domain [Dillenia turbinata]|uniref:Terpene synthase, N-terminal domain n=1 Tax=Dillenia turbinata TaxID=194707 RepID=A0AAN8VCL1_9MAGN
MKSHPSSIHFLVNTIKEEIFSNFHLLSSASHSAYDTAWLAMIPGPHQNEVPMFKSCLDWILHNQRDLGFWGESDHNGNPTLDCLPSTLACTVALKKWNVGSKNIGKGMLELAMASGLQVAFLERLGGLVIDIFCDRRQITKEAFHKYQDPPLLSYLETLPMSYEIDHQEIMKHLSEGGSFFHSPSATAQAFMLMKNKDCLACLKSVVQTCPNGELVKLSLVNHIESLGLAEHFNEEIGEILSQIHRNLKLEETGEAPVKLVPSQLYKEALAFRLRRICGYQVSPRRFCRLLQGEDIVMHIEKNCRDFLSAMYNVYKATDLIFPGEDELEKARSFSRKILERAMSLGCGLDNVVVFPNSQRMLLCLNNDKLTQLAMDNYKFRQSIYMKELEEVTGWSKDRGLYNIGFGREKTTYCYFAFAAACSIPYNSDVRKIVAKSTALVTVADDFYDIEGSLDELHSLTQAVQRWDGTGLTKAGKIIFDALHELVKETAAKHLSQKGSGITKHLQKCWIEIFNSWTKEAEWSRSRATPSMDEYLENGMISIAAHLFALTGSSFLTSSFPDEKLWNDQGHTITKLLMITSRLLNDIQSYQKEEGEGKMNMVLLYLKENPEADIEDSIAHIREFLDEKKKEFLEHVLTNELNDFPTSFKHFHLACFKVFQMFFHSKNRFDSDTEMLHDIGKAIYIPLEVQKPQHLKIPPLQLHPKKGTSQVMACLNPHFTQNGRKKFRLQEHPRTVFKSSIGKIFAPPSPSLCFI